jgi:hypothetical protein
MATYLHPLQSSVAEGCLGSDGRNDETLSSLSELPPPAVREDTASAARAGPRGQRAVAPPTARNDANLPAIASSSPGFDEAPPFDEASPLWARARFFAAAPAQQPLRKGRPPPPPPSRLRIALPRR